MFAKRDWVSTDWTDVMGHLTLKSSIGRDSRASGNEMKERSVVIAVTERKVPRISEVEDTGLVAMRKRVPFLLSIERVLAADSAPTKERNTLKRKKKDSIERRDFAALERAGRRVTRTAIRTSATTETAM